MDNMALREIVAKRLRAAMAADPNLETQEKLAARSGLSQSHISRLLLCEASATTDSLNALAQALRCEPWELLMDTETARRALIERVLLSTPVADQKVEDAYSVPDKVVSIRKRRSDQT